jgi:hypothetical protein
VTVCVLLRSGEWCWKGLQILILSRNGQRFDYWKRKSKESSTSLGLRYDLNRLCWPMELSWMVWFIWWKQFGGGRAGESAAHGVTEDLIAAGFESGRMKTGTPQEWMDVRWIILNERRKRRC